MNVLIRQTIADEINLQIGVPGGVDREDIREVIVRPDMTEMDVRIKNSRGVNEWYGVRVSPVLTTWLNDVLTSDE